MVYCCTNSNVLCLLAKMLKFNQNYVSFMFDNGDLVVQADADGIASSDHSDFGLELVMTMGVTPDPGFDEEKAVLHSS